jgi:hypothetical protein
MSVCASLQDFYTARSDFFGVFTDHRSICLGQDSRIIGCATRQAMDIVFLLGIATFVGLTLALVAGCSALERKK